MQSTNFQPLNPRWLELHNDVCFAETYAYSDRHTAITKQRCFVETVVSTACIPGELIVEVGAISTQGMTA